MPQKMPITMLSTGTWDPQILGTSCGTYRIQPIVKTDGWRYGIRCFRVISTQE